MLSEKNKRFISAIIASSVSIFAYETGFFFFLFIVPLQLLFFKRGKFWARISTLGVGIAVAYIGIIHTAGIEDSHVRFLLSMTEIFIPFLLLGGFLFMNRGNQEVIFKGIIISTVVVAIAGFVMRNFLNDEAFIGYYREQIAVAFNTLKSTLEANGNPNMIPIMGMDVDVIFNRITTIFFRGFLFAYFVILSVSYMFAQHIYRLSNRIYGVMTEVLIPDYFIWVLIAALGLVLVDKHSSLGIAGYLGWNVFLIIMFLYGLKGMKMLRQIYMGLKVPGFMRFCIVFCFVSLLCNPITSVWLLVGIPCVGISEIWFKYKRT